MTKKLHKKLNNDFLAIYARQYEEEKKKNLEYCLSSIDNCLCDAESSLDELNDDLEKWKENIIMKQEQIKNEVSFISSCIEAARKILIELEQELKES